MNDVQPLYDEAKDDLQAITALLFEFGKDQVLKRGTFLPFGATLDSEGEIQLHGAAGENEVTTSTEILPIFHEGLRQSRDGDTRAVADCNSAIRSQPDYMDSYLARGRIYEELGNIEQAMMDFEHIVNSTKSPKVKRVIKRHLKKLKRRKG